MSSKKYNAVVKWLEYFDEGNEYVNISFVTPDHQEHEVTFLKSSLNKSFKPFPAEYFTHPACCEHPEGCPEETRTEKLLKEFNK